MSGHSENGNTTGNASTTQSDVSSRRRDRDTETTSGDDVTETPAQKARFELGNEAKETSWELAGPLVDYPQTYENSYI